MSMKTFFFLPVLFVSFLIQAQSLSTTKIKVATASGVSEKDAIVYLPLSYSASKKYPLVIYTHGVGEAGTDITKLYTTGLPKVLKDGYRPSFDFIMVAVQSASYSVAPEWLPSIVDQSIIRWNIDTGRIYLTGISAGGWGAYGSQLNISSQFGSRFAAIVINSGATQNIIKTNLDWWKSTKTPLWAVVGGADESYLSQSRFMVDEVNKRVVGLAALTVRAGIGHGGWDDVYKGTVKKDSKNMWEWLYQFNRASPEFPKPSTTLFSSDAALSGFATTTTANSEAKLINVNIYGGSNAYAATAWNNWNVSSSLSSGALRYSDATSSSVSATLSKSSGVNDNGSTYGSGMAPASVLRYTSNATVARTLTLSGLSSAKTYGLELYASRNNYSGNYTAFTINGVTQSISTYKNLTATATFETISPNAAGQIAITISNPQNYNYLNGFTLTETGGSTTTEPIIVTSTTTYANHTLPATGGYVNYANGIPITNLKPGDTINVLAGTYTALIFGNFKGDATRPIVIRNKGGQVKTGEIRLTNDAQYFKILGNGHSATQYGFKVYRTDYSGINVSKARDFELAYCEVYGMNVGIFIKNNPISTDASTIYPNYVFKNIYVHHNYVHNIAKEGMYIGHTDPDGGQGGNPLIPVRHENIEIAYNIVDQTGWDGIQLANARTGNKVHHNTITNYGTLNASGQRSGIELGSNTNADVYENTIKRGTGTGIMVFGYGAMNVYNNLLENCGNSYAIYANPYLSAPEDNPKQQMTITNNTVNYPSTSGAIKVGGLSTNSLPSVIQNNKILLPNAPSNWLKVHFYSVVPGSTVTGNTLISF